MNDIKTQILSFIKDQFIATLATVDNGKPNVCTIFYATSNGQILYFTSHRHSAHCKNIDVFSDVAVNIYIHNTIKGYANSKKGVQIIGKAERITNIIEATEGLVLYGKRFIEAINWINEIDDFIHNGGSSGIYKIKVTQAKIFDTENKLKPKEYLNI